MAEIQDTKSLEALAIQFLQVNDQMVKLEEQKEKLKDAVGQLLRLSEQKEYRFNLDPLFDLKITVGVRKSTKIDKRELANDLGVTESAINLEFLLSAVENEKLSLAKFKEYVFQELSEQVSIRRVNAQ